MKLRGFFSPRLLAHLLLLRPLLWALFGVNVHGREHLADLDRFILVSNHNSHLDTLLLYAALPIGQIQRTRPVAAGDYFRRFRWLYRVVNQLFRPIWIDRQGEGGWAVAAIQHALDAGQNIILFPEGTRGEPGCLQSFRGGIGRIAAANPTVPVVAAFLEGPERALPRRASFPIPLWAHVDITPPQIPAGQSQDITLALQEVMESLQERARAGRQKRPVMRRPPFTLAVLGVDGSGKSSLSARLARQLSLAGRACLISDRLELFGEGKPLAVQPLMSEALRRWFSRRAKQATSLARYKIPKLAELLLRDRLLQEAGRWYQPGSVVMDGMPVLNLTAWAILYREANFDQDLCTKVLSVLTNHGLDITADDPVYRQHPELTRLKRLRLDKLRLPDAAIFLDVPAPVCLDRIARRGEARQVHETPDKLSKLAQAYRVVCAVLERRWQIPLLILDGNRDFETVAAEASRFAQEAREGRHDD